MWGTRRPDRLQIASCPASGCGTRIVLGSHEGIFSVRFCETHGDQLEVRTYEEVQRPDAVERDAAVRSHR